MPLKSRKRPRLQRDGASAILDIIGRQAALLHPPMLHSQPYFLTQHARPPPHDGTWNGDSGNSYTGDMTEVTQTWDSLEGAGESNTLPFPHTTLLSGEGASHRV